MENKKETLEYRGYMKGHGGWVQCLQMGEEKVDDGTQEFLISGSRDKTLCIWDITPKKNDEGEEWGIPRRIMTGHSHFVNDISLSQDSRYCLSASWDGTIRLWDLQRAVTTRRFVSHKKDVLSVSFSTENRQIASGARDNDLKIWNTVGECKYTVENNGHTDWVSCVRFSPDSKKNIVASSSWDKTIKIWDSQTMQLKNTFVGHTAHVNSIAFSIKAAYLASGGKDGRAMLWNVNEGTHMKNFEADAEINQVLFAPKKFFLVIATVNSLKVYDLLDESVIADIKPTPIDPAKKAQKKPLSCLSVAWDKEGKYLFSGWSDNMIRVHEVVVQE